MNANNYYRYQAASRGLLTVDDVICAARLRGQLYDRALIDWLPNNREASIYEAACGPGIFLLWLRSRGYVNIHGSDSAEADIALARAAQLPVKLADSLADLREMERESKACIVGLDFYEHLSKDMMLDFFSESHRVLRRGGILLLRGPNGDSPVIGRSLFNDITHEWALTSVAFRAVLKMVGFTEIAFRDDAIPSIQRYRFIKIPFVYAAQALVRGILKAATREDIPCISASFFVRAIK